MTLKCCTIGAKTQLTGKNNWLMSKFESSIRQIDYPQQNVYNLLSDLSNVEKIKDKVPADKIKDLTFDTDSISINSPMGAVKLRIVDREEPKCIKFETEQSPLPFDFWIQILPVTDTTSKIKLTIKAELNPFIKGMVKKPLEQAIEKIADALQLIKYE
jgi:carbon monoxide dehydrogenase subunit G